MPEFITEDEADDDKPVVSVEITRMQFAVLKRLTNQRSAHFWSLIDLTGEMQHEGLEFFRRLGAPEGKEIALFLTTAKPETLEFLTEMRVEEIAMLKNGIRLVVALGWVGWCFKWLALTAFGAFVGGVTIWKEVAAWFKSTH